jgi:chaperonin GroES
MKPRLVDRIQGKYKAAEFAGNKSGVTPLGKKVLVLTDEFEGTFAGGKLEFLSDQVERMNLASESGVIVQCSAEAFTHHYDGSRWMGRTPAPGDHVYFEKYAGLLVMGNDGKKYRLMDDSCIGAIYNVESQEEGAEDGNEAKPVDA